MSQAKHLKLMVWFSSNSSWMILLSLNHREPEKREKTSSFLWQAHCVVWTFHICPMYVQTGAEESLLLLFSILGYVPYVTITSILVVKESINELIPKSQDSGDSVLES